MADFPALPPLETNSDLFDEGFRGFIFQQQQKIPELTLTTSIHGARRRHTIWYAGLEIAEIDTLPIHGREENERLEVKVAAMNRGKQVGIPQFCTAFYRWVQIRYGFAGLSPDPIFRDLTAYVSYLETMQETLAHWENVQLPAYEDHGIFIEQVGDETAEVIRQITAAENQRGLMPIPTDESQSKTPEPKGEEQKTSQAKILDHPDIRKRRDEVLKLKQQGWTRAEIAQKANTTEDTVKKDLEWLRAKGLLPRGKG